MNEAEKYISEIMFNIHAPVKDRQRMEADLRAHLQEALDHGEPIKAAIARMGTPTEVAAEFMAQVTLDYASFWRRLAASIVDYLIVIVAAGALAILALAPGALAGWRFESPRGLEWLSVSFAFAATMALALTSLGAIVVYFPILEGRFGQTAGKRLLGIRVLKENGLAIGYKEAFLRRIPSYFRFMPLDALFIFFTAKRQRAFDIVARTVVVREV